MKLNRSLKSTVILSLVALVLFSIFCAPSFASDVIIKKMVSGKVQRVDPCFIVKNAKEGDVMVVGKDLSEVVGKEVKIVGVLKEDKNGNQVVEIEKYEESKK